MLIIAALLTICAPGPRDNCVVDGDTIWIAGEKIRVVEIDTPEIDHAKCIAEQGAGVAAKLRLLALLNQGSVTIQRKGIDRYGRTLASVSVNARNVGLQLVREGLARIYDGRRHPWC